MQRFFFRRLPYISKAQARYYFAIEPLDDPESDFAAGVGESALPTASLVNGRYVSSVCKGGSKKNLKDVLNWLWTSKQSRLSLPSFKYHDKENIIEAEVDYRKIQDRKSSTLSWVGHSTLFVTINGVNILTDPIWSDHASPIQGMGPKRYTRPALALDKLEVDIVLLSHTHYDHLDYSTATKIGNKSLWIVPLGVSNILSGFGITNVVELDWWCTYRLSTSEGRQVDVTLTPTKHWSSRNPFDRNKTLWGSYVVKSTDKNFFFGGDTAYHDVFKTIGEKYGPFDFSALPIGAYKPRWFLKDNHVNPAEAVQIHKDIRSKQSVAIHWGTFPLSDEDYVEPPLELARMRQIMGVSSSNFFSLMHGDTWKVGENPSTDFAVLNPVMFEEYLNHYCCQLESDLSTRHVPPI